MYGLPNNMPSSATATFHFRHTLLATHGCCDSFSFTNNVNILCVCGAFGQLFISINSEYNFGGISGQRQQTMCTAHTHTHAHGEPEIGWPENYHWQNIIFVRRFYVCVCVLFMFRDISNIDYVMFDLVIHRPIISTYLHHRDTNARTSH